MGILPFMTYQGFEVELRKPFSIYHFPFDICYPVDWVARSSLPLACFPLNQMENHRCQMKNGKWFFVCQLTKSERTSSNPGLTKSRACGRTVSRPSLNLSSSAI